MCYSNGGVDAIERSLKQCIKCRRMSYIFGMCEDCLDLKRREYLKDPRFRESSYMTRAEAKEFCTADEFKVYKCRSEGCENKPGRSTSGYCLTCAVRVRRKLSQASLRDRKESIGFM
jgi:hypothetical protein